MSLSNKTRLIRFILGLVLLGGFGLARTLDPNPAGFGTHTQFGFPECSFRFYLNIPCPNCGITTSFAHFVRGEIVRSAQANIAGLVFAVECLLLLIWGLATSLSGRELFIRRPWTTLMWGMVLYLSLSFLLWFVRLLPLVL